MKEKEVTDHKQESKLLWQFLKGCKGTFVVTIIAAGVMALADMINPQIIRAAVDNAIGHETANYPAWVMCIVDSVGGFEYLAKHLWIMALAVLIVALIRAVSTYLFRVCNTKASEVLVKNMRDSLFSHIEHLPFSWHMKNKTGDIIQRCTSDIDTTKNFVSERLTSLFRIVILLILSLVFMGTMNIGLTVIAFVPVPFIVLYSVHFHKKLVSGFAECDENEGILSSMAQENLTGVRVVRAFGRENYEKERFEAHNEHYTKLWVKMAKVMSRFWSVSDVLSGLQVMLVVVFGAVFCIYGKMTAGEYIAFISYNSLLVWPVRELGRMLSDMSKAGVSIARINYIMSSKIEQDKDGAVIPPMNGDIAFEHVQFAYPQCPQMLYDINFTMQGGTTLGILGGTGSGKSTMMCLLDKLYDLPENCGRITIGGVDIRDIQTEYLRQNIGIVLQEPYLFSRTIAENIGITREDITLSEIREAARAACLDQTVEDFAKGYETFVGERGVTLSGGQKQRAAIARILTQQTPIMIFDDSLSAVDTETDEKIRKELEQHFGKASIILISHRITTLSKADHILVLDHGNIVEQGTHHTLKSAGGIYQKIYEIQSGMKGEKA